MDTRIQLSVASDGDVNVHHNTFQKCPEDHIKFSGNNLWFHDNEIGGTRTLSNSIATWLGGPVPPHPDGIQQMGPCDDFIIENNVFINTTFMHGGLIRNAAASGKSRRVIIRGNEIRTPDDTGMEISDIMHDGGSGINGSNLDAIITGNKCWTGGISAENIGPVFGFRDYDPSVIGARVSFTNNVGTRVWNAGFPGNTQSNSGGVWPTGWVDKARDRVARGQPFSGRYGATAGVIP